MTDLGKAGEGTRGGKRERKLLYEKIAQDLNLWPFLLEN